MVERAPSERPRVLVTGAGGPAGVNLIRELGRLGYASIGCDCDPYAAGLQLADSAGVIPRVDEPGYLPALLDLAARENAAALVSTMTEELVFLPEHTTALGQAGLAFWFPAQQSAEVCRDKLTFAQVSRAAGQPVPMTAGGDVERALATVPGPWIIKPRFGRGSRDVHQADTAAEVKALWSQVPEPVLQTRLRGSEFTIDTLVDREGVLIGAVPRFRLATKSGISTTGRTFSSPGLRELVASLLTSLNLTGPANVQGFLASDGAVGFIEVNPRFSGGLPLSLAAGSDLVGQYLRGVFGEPLDAAALSYQVDLLMIRHWTEIFVSKEYPPTPSAHPIRGT